MTFTNSKNVFLVIGLLLVSGFAQAQAFCALRDPKTGIYDLYPEADNYRSIVRTVDTTIKQVVEERLPPETLHFSELGRHTLYVALKDQNPVGFVHVRSEESRWGLVEIAWALDMNLRIVDFRFQRCRSSQKKHLEDESFRAQLKGKSYSDLKELLQPGTSLLAPGALAIPDGAEELAEVLIRCALKTTLVTELAWAEDIQLLRAEGEAVSAFGEFSHIQMVTDPYTEKVRAGLETALQGANLGVDYDSVSLAKVYGPEDELLGSLYSNVTDIDGQPTYLSWVIDTDNRIRNVTNMSGWRSERDEMIFAELRGKRFDDADHCGNRVELLALEAVITANH